MLNKTQIPYKNKFSMSRESSVSCLNSPCQEKVVSPVFLKKYAPFDGLGVFPSTSHMEISQNKKSLILET